MGLLIGFSTILVVIAAGAALAHVGVLDRRSQRTLGEIAFFVASPALMVVTISKVHLETAAANLVADPDRPLSETLLDQRVMAGVGNVYANELCFLFGHLPTASAGAVKDPLRLAQRARDMLWLNRSRFNRTTTGDTRRGQQVWVYGRSGEPCRRCGTAIKTDRTGDRVTFWCPNCQT
jgi:formamidopyrimidine-DNA glycosylase